MTVKDATLPTRAGLTEPERALLYDRLARARQAAGRAAQSQPSIPRRPPGRDIPLSFAQERLWFLDQLEPGSVVYNVCQAVRMRGNVNFPVLQRAFDEIVRRHEALRTNFVATEGNPVQVVAPERRIPLRTPGPAEDWRRALEEESRRPFDLARDPLIRVWIARTAPAEHVMMVTLHHIISDGWSLGLLFRELAALYLEFSDGRTSPLADLPVQYADYVFWERERMQGPALERLLTYWREALGDQLPVLELPADHPRGGNPGSRGAAESIQLSRTLAQGLRTVGQRDGATLFMTLLAAFQVLLFRWSGQEEVVVGTAVAGRRKVELEKLLGFFVNTLVFRGDLGGEPTFRQLLARTRDIVVGALAHQDLPFERLVKELKPDRSLSRNPLFQVMFVLQNEPPAPSRIGSIELEPLDVDTGNSKFDLTLSMLETPAGLTAALEYNTERFERATTIRTLGMFSTLLEGIAADPEQKITRLPILTPQERRGLLVERNATASEYPRARTIPELFGEEVARAPGSIALDSESRRMTYAELDSRANRLARLLRRLGVREEDRVGVCLERSSGSIVALLAILKAGGAYVSLDPAYPARRLAFMLRDSGARVLLTQESLGERARDVVEIATKEEGLGGPPPVLRIDSDWSRIANESEAAVRSAVGPEGLAYVSYTSGTTGRPKGVCVPHRGVVRLVKGADYAHFGPDEVFLHYAPVAFDASTFEIWGALLNGARLVVHPPGPASLTELGDRIERAGVTTLWLTAGLFHQLVEERIGALRNVRQLLAGGDVLSPAHVARVLAELPRTALINGYGPTENTTFTCCHRITTPPRPGASVPIGRPIANTRVYILDGALEPVPVGTPGELYAGGDGLARGYLNLPELTEARFVTHAFEAGRETRLYRTGDRARWLPDGSIEFLGRIDRQVKIRGFRVEPAEVEAALGSHPGVKEAVVVVRDDPACGKRLVAYVVARKNARPAVDEWRAHLAQTLADHLVPSAFIALDSLPLTPNGKLDARRLPVDGGARAESHGEYVAPRDAVERRLAAIWTEVLDVNPVGVHDPFFALGGHSLLAVRLVARLEKAFGSKLPVAAVFQAPTVAQMARLLSTPEPQRSESNSLVEIQGGRGRRPLYLIHGVGGGMFWGYANLARHLGGDQPLYAFKSRGMDGLPEWRTIEEMAASYLADLRARQPHGPYLLGGYCFGGIVAYEMARRLREDGEEIALLVLINGSPPNTSYQRDFSRLSPAWQARFALNFGYWLGCFFFRWTRRERREFLRWKLRRRRRRRHESNGADHPQFALGDIDQLFDLAAYSEERRALWRSHVLALSNYQPKPFAGRITLLRTRGHPLVCSFDPQYGWGELAAGGVEVRIVRGGHGNVLAEPFVQGVAAALRLCLDSAAVRHAEVRA